MEYGLPNVDNMKVPVDNAHPGLLMEFLPLATVWSGAVQYSTTSFHNVWIQRYTTGCKLSAKILAEPATDLCGKKNVEGMENGLPRHILPAWSYCKGSVQEEQGGGGGKGRQCDFCPNPFTFLFHAQTSCKWLCRKKNVKGMGQEQPRWPVGEDLQRKIAVFKILV